MNIKEALKRNSIVSDHLTRKRLIAWAADGYADSVPQEVKVSAISYYALAHKLDTFIETGTYKGDMVWAQKDLFKRLFSIELSKDLCERARDRFKNFDHIVLLQGDSSDKIGEALNVASSSALIFLDGHYSGGETAMGTKECPIFEELTHVFSSPFDHFIIIDDARLFVGKNDYPTIGELAAFVSESGYITRTESDFIVLESGNHIKQSTQ